MSIQESSFEIVRRLRLELAASVVTGLAIVAGAKYLASGFLVFWLLAGGQ